MKKTIVSKCGARFSHKKEVEFLHNEKPQKQFSETVEEKPVQKKRTYRKVFEKLGEDFPVNIEDEN